MDMRNARQAADGTPVLQQVRVDVWLDVACLFKTRSEAQKACSGGKVEVNGQATKPHRLLGVGDEVRITRGRGRRMRYCSLMTEGARRATLGVLTMVWSYSMTSAFSPKTRRNALRRSQTLRGS